MFRSWWRCIMELPEFVEFPKIARLSREIIITEKIDGTNAVIFIGDDGRIIAGSRSQWLFTRKAGGADNHGFGQWVEDHVEDLRQLGPGRHYGEWWGSGIQRGYGLSKGEKRFSLFNTSRWSDATVRPKCCHVVPILYTGPFTTDAVDNCLTSLRINGSQASPGFMRPEGVILFHSQGNVGFKKTLERDEEW